MLAAAGSHFAFQLDLPPGEHAIADGVGVALRVIERRALVAIEGDQAVMLEFELQIIDLRHADLQFSIGRAAHDNRRGGQCDSGAAHALYCAMMWPRACGLKSSKNS